MSNSKQLSEQKHPVPQEPEQPVQSTEQDQEIQVKSHEDKKKTQEERLSISASARIEQPEAKESNKKEQEKEPEEVLAKPIDVHQAVKEEKEPLVMSIQKSLRESRHASKHKSMSKGSKSQYKKCAICMKSFQDDPKSKKQLACTHTFHTECLSIKSKSPNCPLCSGTQLMIETPKERDLKEQPA